MKPNHNLLKGYIADELDRSKNKLNISHNDLNRMYELSISNSSFSAAITELLVLWKLLDTDIVDDQYCYSNTWCIPKQVWTQYFDLTVTTSCSVETALSITKSFFYTLYEANEDFEFELLSRNECIDYYTWFDEIQDLNPDFEFNYASLDEMLE